MAHVLANALVPDEAATAVDFEHGVACEQVGDVLPLALVDVLSVRALQIADRQVILRRLCAGFE